jgi:hypothetical protein
MKSLFSIFLFFFSLTYLPAAHAAEPDPLWIKVLDKRNAMKKWIANEVEVKFDYHGEQRSFKKQLVSWDQSTPVYKVSSSLPEGVAKKLTGKTLDPAKPFEKLLENIYSPDFAVSRQDKVIFNGKATTLFAANSGIAPRLRLNIWVDPESAAIYESELEIYMPLAMHVKTVARFQLDDLGRNLPLNTETEMEILIPFKGDKVRIRDSYSQWQENTHTKSAGSN